MARIRGIPRGESQQFAAVTTSGDGFILVLGMVYLHLDREAAEDLVCQLAEALEPDEPFTLMSPRTS